MTDAKRAGQAGIWARGLNKRLVPPEPHSRPGAAEGLRYFEQRAPRWARMILGAAIGVIAALGFDWILKSPF